MRKVTKTYIIISGNFFQISGKFGSLVDLVELDGLELRSQRIQSSLGDVAVGAVGRREDHHLVVADQFVHSEIKNKHFQLIYFDHLFSFLGLINTPETELNFDCIFVVIVIVVVVLIVVAVVVVVVVRRM